MHVLGTREVYTHTTPTTHTHNTHTQHTPTHTPTTHTHNTHPQHTPTTHTHNTHPHTHTTHIDPRPPTQPPGHLIAFWLSNGHIDVQWDAPAPPSLPSRLRGYKLNWDIPGAVSQSARDAVPPHQLQYVVTSGLDPRNSYTILVWAYSLGGDGPPARVQLPPLSEFVFALLTHHRLWIVVLPGGTCTWQDTPRCCLDFTPLLFSAPSSSTPSSSTPSSSAPSSSALPPTTLTPFPHSTPSPPLPPLSPAPLPPLSPTPLPPLSPTPLPPLSPTPLPPLSPAPLPPLSPTPLPPLSPAHFTPSSSAPPPLSFCHRLCSCGTTDHRRTTHHRRTHAC